MCLDDILKNIWTPSFYNDLQKELNNQIFEGHEGMADRMVEEAKDKVDSIKQYMKHRSVYFLIITVFIMLLLGFEEMYMDRNYESGQLFVETIIPTLVIVSFLFMFIFYKYSFKRPQNLFFSLFVVSVITIGVCVLNELSGLCFRYSMIWGIGIVLFLMISPVLWQLFVLWVFTNGYKVYIGELLRKEKVDYNKIISAIKEERVDDLPLKYIQHLGKQSFLGKDQKEVLIQKCLNEYIEGMDNEIAQASRLKSVLKIFIFWVKYTIKIYFRNALIKFGFKTPKTLPQD